MDLKDSLSPVQVELFYLFTILKDSNIYNNIHVCVILLKGAR